MPQGAEVELALDDGSIIPLTVHDVDDEGIIARAATWGERDAGGRAMVGEADTSIVQLSPGDILLTWVGSVCERGYTLVASERAALLMPDPRNGCDLARHLYAVVLTFAAGVDASSYDIELRSPVILDK
jgi:hypothetical protein